MSEERRVAIYGNPRNAPQRFDHAGENIRLETDRLYLRPLTMSDASDAYGSWYAEREVERILGRPAQDWTRHDASLHISRFNNREALHLGIFDKETDEHIGFVTLFLRRNDTSMLTIVIGDQSRRRQGLALEVGQRLQEFVFDELGYNKICAQVHGLNEAALSFAKRLGLEEEAVLREFYKEPDGSRPAQHNFGMLRSEWEARRNMG